MTVLPELASPLDNLEADLLGRGADDLAALPQVVMRVIDLTADPKRPPRIWNESSVWTRRWRRKILDPGELVLLRPAAPHVVPARSRRLSGVQGACATWR